MRKLGLAGFATAMGLSICGAGAVEITQVRGKFSCSDLESQQQCAQTYEKRFVADHPLMLLREKGQLKVRLNNGEYFSLSGKEPDEFNVLELQADGRFAIIRQQYSEGNSWQILDIEKGKLTDIHGYPLFSPDNTRFVAASEDLEAGYSQTILDIYDVSPEGVTPAFRAIGPDDSWAARDVRWSSRDIVSFSQARLSSNAPASGYDETPAYLLFRNGVWELRRGRAY